MPLLSPKVLPVSIEGILSRLYLLEWFSIETTDVH